ncbi:hypothetical protein LPB140_09800 [Sphingorhabdus lutea]|uniref:Inositolphosphotransferase Aur1/Ipt1 domain-containing protein n=1 Tax=Sphingorhabdus lutea TaxID=1913578 RepID=A0A1L3JD35_9SPHN|nr:phosphatase PAP2 family protein [Sphingorhabdus lutea]APG63032.1 hypothetical protein LPB140_09800 [Sphingorhabdus lutea]
MDQFAGAAASHQDDIVNVDDGVPATQKTRSNLKNILLYQAPLPELALAAIFLILALLMGAVFRLPFVVPNGDALDFVGMNPAVPFIIITLWGLATMMSKRKMRVIYYAVATFAYCIILLAHFNVKLWMNMVNPQLWDDFYWKIDQSLRPVIDGAFQVHHVTGKIIPFENNLYLVAFLSMFVVSIIVHSLRCFTVFRKVIFTAMLVHVLGGLSYLIMPAVGPFIYEAGVNPLETIRQAHMYGGYQALMEGGRPWLAAQGGEYMFAAIAAMPSLHVASSAVFVYYALRHERWLGIAYLPLFFFIVAESMASRWHYAVDALGGILVTSLAIWICSIVFRPIEAQKKQRL